MHRGSFAACLVLAAATWACGPDFSKDDSGGDDASDGDGADGSDGSDGGGSTPVLYINELMASNTATVEDESGAFPDWVELYNPGDEAVDLLGWSVTDDLSEPGKHTFTASLAVPAGGFLILWADDDEEDGDQHVGFNLAAEGEQFGLFAADGAAVDQVEFGALASDLSVARTPDGSENWSVTEDPTPGASNGG